MKGDNGVRKREIQQSRGVMHDVQNGYTKLVQRETSSFSAPRNVYAFLVACVFSLYAEPAYAATKNLGELVCSVSQNVLPGYALVLSAAAYCIGAVFALRSALLFKRHSDNPAQTSMVPAIAHLFVGGILASLPSFANVMITTVFGASGAATGGGASGGCMGAGSGPATATAGVGMDVILTNFVQNLHKPMFILIAVIGFLVGATFIMQALLRGAKTGTNPQAADPKNIIVNLLFGAILMSLSTALPGMLATLFGDDSVSNMATTTNIIQWSSIVGSGAGTAQAEKAMRAVLAFIQIVGGVSFLRGWLLLKKATEGGQATIAQGLTHIIAGAMCIRIDLMTDIFDSTFGTNLIN